MDDALRLTTKKKAKHKAEKSTMTKKRRRAGSVDVGDAAAASMDPLERLAAFRERMFDMKHDEKLSHAASSGAQHPEDAVVLAKWKPGKDGKAKKRKTMGFNGDDNDDDDMPRITVKKASASSSKPAKKKGKDKAKSPATTTAVPVKSSAVKIPGGTPAAAAKSAPVDSNLHAWKRQNSQNADGTSASLKSHKLKVHDANATASSFAKAKKQAASSAKSAGVAEPYVGVVTQDQLALFDDVMSFEDPLEKAMQAVKEQMAASSSRKVKSTLERVETKAVQKEKKKAEKHKAEEPAAELDTNDEKSEKVAKKQDKKDKKAEKRNRVDSDALVADETKASVQSAARKHDSPAPAAPAMAKETVNVTTDPKSSRQPKRKLEEASTATSTTTVQVSVVTVSSTPQASSAPAADGEQKKMSKKKKKKRQRARANSVSSLTAHEAPAPNALPAATSDAKLEMKANAKAAEPSKNHDDSVDDDDDELVKSMTSSPKKADVAKAPDAQPAAQKHKHAAAKAHTAQTPSSRILQNREHVKSTAAHEAQLPPASPFPSKKRQKVEKAAAKQPISSSVGADATTTKQATRKKGSVNGAVMSSSFSAYQQSQDLTETEMNTESGDEHDRDFDFHDAYDERSASSDDSDEELAAAVSSQQQVFSNLIDEAARQQWELLEVGRLVKLFAGQWGHKKARTARFLRQCCPELVNVDFLEGLGVQLGAEHLVKIFARGSGNSIVLMNKLASAIENGDLNVREPAFLNIVAKQVRTMATNYEVLEFLVPLLESLSTVRDVSQLLKHICQHWHVDRTAALVQQILLTAVFDDLDGDQDELLRDLPQLAGKLDFPSRLDQEDADENGNLIGLIANEDSDLGEASDDGGIAAEAEEALGEIHSDDDDHEDEDDDDDDDDEEPYEGETDSEEERAIREQHRPKRRNPFILDEADEDNEDEDDELETEDDDDDDNARYSAQQRRGGSTKADESSSSSSSSSSDSEDDTWRSKPKR